MNEKIRIVSASGTILAIAVALLVSGRLSAGKDDARAEKAVKDLAARSFVARRGPSWLWTFTRRR